MNMSSRASASIGVLAVASIPAILGLAGCTKEVERAISADTAPKPVTVAIAPIGQRDVERTVEGDAPLRAWEHVTIGTKKEGRVVKVLHDIGDRVRPGEPIVLLDTVDADLAVVQSERRFQAELAKLGLKETPTGEFDAASVPSVVKAKVALERVHQNLARERTLIKRNAGGLQDYQNTENDQKAAEASLADAILAVQSTLASALAAKATLDVSIQARKDMEIHAPLPSSTPAKSAGAAVYGVAKRAVSEGQYVKVGDSIVELVIDRPLRLWTTVPEQFTGAVKLGQKVRVRVDAFPDTPFEGTIVRINPTVDMANHTFQVESQVNNDDGRLRPGVWAKASIVIDQHAKATVVPIESVMTYAGVTKVFVVENDKSRSVRVEKGQEGDGWVEVRGDLPPRGSVVVEGQTQLADGTPVVIRSKDAKEASKPTE